MRFYVVDAFTDALFGGNPAGVVILDQGTDFPAEETMRKTAAELRYSETAFIRQTGDDEFHFRYFTPAAEVDLCGHATIGSFFALADAGLVRFDSFYTCNTLAGRLNIELFGSSVFMDMGAPKDLGKITDKDALHELYSVMGLGGKTAGEMQVELAAGEEKSVQLIPEIISTGLPDILLPVRDERGLAAITPDYGALSRLSEKYEAVGVHAFTVNAEDGAVHCRNFAPLYGIDEEAATGTSNGALTYYLYKNGLLRAGTENLFIQGEAMGRPSKIMSRLTAEAGRVKIQVGGGAVILAHGVINL
jgi:PhzF family phenazine biosynthesis protein